MQVQAGVGIKAPQHSSPYPLNFVVNYRFHAHAYSASFYSIHHWYFLELSIEYELNCHLYLALISQF